MSTRKAYKKKSKNKINDDLKSIKKYEPLVVVILLIAIIGIGIISSINVEFRNSIMGLIFGQTGSPAVTKVHFIDVGQGDAIYIEFPDGKNMLIDAGDNRIVNRTALINYLNECGVNDKGLDILMLTHGDNDHVGGMGYILDTYTVRNIFMPNLSGTATTSETDIMGTLSTVVYRNFCAKVASEGADIIYNEGILDLTQAVLGAEYDISNVISYDMDIYCPPTSYYNNISGDSPSEAKNNMGPICILEFGGRKVVFTGDLGSDELSSISNAQQELYPWSEERFVSYLTTNMINFDCDVLKVGHHGSNYSSSNYFLSALNVEYAVISVGEYNPYGHPGAEALSRLNAANITTDNIFCTDNCGSIVLTIGENGGMSFTFTKAAA